MSLETVPDLVAEEALGELEDQAHGPGQVHEVYLLVAHGECALTAREGLGNLTGGPDRDLVPGYGLLVQHVGKSTNLK